MKKIIKYILIVVIILISIYCIYSGYRYLSIKQIIEEKKQLVEKDAIEYGEKYEKFSSEVYKEKPDRIIFKKENTINEFYVFNIGDKEYDNVLKLSEDRMFYSANQDFNLWCFTPYTLDDISNSNENFIIFDYNDNSENKDYMYDWDFNRDIFFRFSNNTRLYRLMDYTTYIKESVNKENLQTIIGKDEFINKNQIISGYKYMNPSLFTD